MMQRIHPKCRFPSPNVTSTQPFNNPLPRKRPQSANQRVLVLVSLLSVAFGVCCCINQLYVPQNYPVDLPDPSLTTPKTTPHQPQTKLLVYTYFSKHDPTQYPTQESQLGRQAFFLCPIAAWLQAFGHETLRVVGMSCVANLSTNTYSGRLLGGQPFHDLPMGAKILSRKSFLEVF